MRLRVRLQEVPAWPLSTPWAASGGKLLAEIEAVYDYRAGRSRLLFQVLRKRGKASPAGRPLSLEPGGHCLYKSLY